MPKIGEFPRQIAHLLLLLAVVVEDLLHVQQLIGIVYKVLQKINKVEEVERRRKRAGRGKKEGIKEGILEEI